MSDPSTPEPPIIPNQPQAIASEPSASSSSDESKTKLINNRVAIFCMLFCVTGFLGIPVLCYSEAFTKTEKIIWSIVVTIYTCILIAITAWIVYWCLGVIFGW